MRANSEWRASSEYIDSVNWLDVDFWDHRSQNVLRNVFWRRIASRERVARILTSELTFEKKEKSARTRVWWQIDILKSQHAAKFTVCKHYTADFWEFVAEGVIRRVFRRQREILKYLRAAQCTMWKCCRADFWEFVAEEVIRRVFRGQLAVWWSGIGAGSTPAKYHGEILQVLRVVGVNTSEGFSLLSCVDNFWHPTYFWCTCLSPYTMQNEKFRGIIFAFSCGRISDTLHTSDMHASHTSYHAIWEGPSGFLCFPVWMNFVTPYILLTYTLLTLYTTHSEKVREIFFAFSCGWISDTLHTSDIHTSHTLHHTKQECPSNSFCFLV